MRIDTDTEDLMSRLLAEIKSHQYLKLDIFFLGHHLIKRQGVDVEGGSRHVNSHNNKDIHNTAKKIHF